MTDAFIKFSTYIPKKERIRLFNCLYQEFNCNSRLLSKFSGIQLRRIYFYFPSEKNKIRNYPNDHTTYLLLRSYFDKNPKKAILFLTKISEDINKLKNVLCNKKIRTDITKLYDITM